MINSISLGIMAYNEEDNIARLLEAILKQRFTKNFLKEIFVVSSGSTDQTDTIVAGFCQKDSRIRLIIQKKREGKASAINLFLSHATGDIMILESGDTLPEKDTLDKLVVPFENEHIGMTGAHPIPVNPHHTFIGFTVHLMWSLHHNLALTAPKLGELIAFRNIVKQIPIDTAVDESSIESIVARKGYLLQYVPEAIVYNKGPDNVREFIRQRRRIAAGHKHLHANQGYVVSTDNPFRIMVTLYRNHTWDLIDSFWTLGAICLESIGRLLGYLDFYIFKKNPYMWDISQSTKSLSK